MAIYIGGHGGFGKSTLAKRIRREIDNTCQVFHMDLIRSSLAKNHPNKLCDSHTMCNIITTASGMFKGYNSDCLCVIEGIDVTIEFLLRNYKDGDLVIYLGVSEDVDLNTLFNSRNYKMDFEVFKTKIYEGILRDSTVWRNVCDDCGFIFFDIMNDDYDLLLQRIKEYIQGTDRYRQGSET